MHRIFTTCPNGVTFFVHLTPGASKNCISGLRIENNDAISIKISVHGKPVNNCANTDLINFIAKTFNLPKTNISILSGIKSRNKKILLSTFGINDIPMSVQRLIIQQIKKQLNMLFEKD